VGTEGAAGTRTRALEEGGVVAGGVGSVVLPNAAGADAADAAEPAAPDPESTADVSEPDPLAAVEDAGR
jgi:hypothetical protein